MNLNQITIGVTNLERSIEFYIKLGLKLIVHSTNHYARFECPDGDSTFSLHVCNEVPENQTVLYFELEDLDSRVKELQDQYRIVFDSLPENQNWLWKEAILFDPDGNKIKLYHAGENRKNPPWRIS